MTVNELRKALESFEGTMEVEVCIFVGESYEGKINCVEQTRSLKGERVTIWAEEPWVTPMHFGCVNHQERE